MSPRALALALGGALALLHASQTRAETARPLTLTSALASALVANPRLTAAERDIGMAAGRNTQAGALPNPNLSLEVDNAAGSGSYQGLDLAEQPLQISQLVELGGKREARMAAAGAGVGVARWEREAIRLQVLAETASAFAAVLGAQQRAQVLETQVTAIQRLAPLLQNRVQAGDAVAILAFSIRQRWLVVMACLAVGAVGAWNFTRLPIDAVPDITNVQAQINTSAPGLSPLETEQRITFPIETAMGGLPGLQYTRSLFRRETRPAALPVAVADGPAS